MKDREEVRGWILEWLERELRISSNEIATDKSLLDYGIDSVNAIMLVGDLENQLKVRLRPTLLWDHPTVDALTEAVLNASPATTDMVQDNSNRSTHEYPESSTLNRDEAMELLKNLDQLSDEQVSELLVRLHGE